MVYRTGEQFIPVFDFDSIQLTLFPSQSSRSWRLCDLVDPPCSDTPAVVGYRTALANISWKRLRLRLRLLALLSSCLVLLPYTDWKVTPSLVALEQSQRPARQRDDAVRGCVYADPQGIFQVWLERACPGVLSEQVAFLLMCEVGELTALPRNSMPSSSPAPSRRPRGGPRSTKSTRLPPRLSRT